MRAFADEDMTMRGERGLFDISEPVALGVMGQRAMRAAEMLMGALAEVTDRDERIEVLNKIRSRLHGVSPFASEPVDFVRWVPLAQVVANDYNPNSVAPPEMALLEHSIREDGYTQPVVAWPTDEGYEVVDGFHRNRVARESLPVSARVQGYLPVTVINENRVDRSDRIAATIRHNRARGKHEVSRMSDIVVELKRRGWTDERIGRELGMEPDEVLRLCQITGLAELFADQGFSKSWDVEGEVTEADATLTDDISTYADEGFRTANTSDPQRIFHTHDKWECHKAGFYALSKPGLSKADGEEEFRVFLTDLPRFADALEHVITEWKHSCEHYLTNAAMNRIAWLGQAATCYATGIPAAYRGGFYLLTEAEQLAANECALEHLNKWLTERDREPVTLEEGYSGDRQVDIY